MYLAGVSVSRVEDIAEALWGTKVSFGTISNLNKKAYEHIETWRTRPLFRELSICLCGWCLFETQLGWRVPECFHFNCNWCQLGCMS